MTLQERFPELLNDTIKKYIYTISKNLRIMHLKDMAILLGTTKRTLTSYAKELHPLLVYVQVMSLHSLVTRV